jgi:catechol 2,3-dioxygenase-like lactoylglutathione lyase family enzyme
MRTHHFIVIALVCVCAGCAVVVAPTQPAASKSTATPANSWNGPSFKRMTIMVSNLDRTVRLWRDILGFEVVVNATSGPDSYSYPVFNIARNASIRYAIVSAGPDQQRTFAFAEVKGQPVQVPQSPRVAAAVINANGRLAEIIKLVAAEGMQVVPATVLRSATNGVGIEQAFVDLDGHLIVLYEFPKPGHGVRP